METIFALAQHKVQSDRDDDDGDRNRDLKIQHPRDDIIREDFFCGTVMTAIASAISIFLHGFAAWLSIFKNVNWALSTLGIFTIAMFPIALVLGFFAIVSYAGRGAKEKSARERPFEYTAGVAAVSSFAISSIAAFSRKNIATGFIFALYALASVVTSWVYVQMS